MWNQLLSMIKGLFARKHERYPGDDVANIVCEIADHGECAQDVEWAFSFAESRVARQDERAKLRSADVPVLSPPAGES